MASMVLFVTIGWMSSLLWYDLTGLAPLLEELSTDNLRPCVRRRLVVGEADTEPISHE